VFCDACSHHLDYVLEHLPVAVEPLAAIARHVTFEIHYRTIDIHHGSGALHSPVPLDVQRDAVVRLALHVAETWAEIVTTDAGRDWDQQAAQRATVYRRMSDACRVLRYRMPEWLDVGPRTVRARSLTVNRWDGHDVEQLTRYGGDLWTKSTGAEAAVDLVRIHDAATSLDPGLQRDDSAPGVCRHCHRSGVLAFVHDLGIVKCSACGDSRSEKAYTGDEPADPYLAAALAGCTR
jgi:hypothetical protein